MFRFTMVVSLVCALCFLAAAPNDLEARCGSSSGRAGLFSRFRLFNRQSSASYQSTYRATYTTQAVVPIQQYQQSVTVRSKASGGCPGGVCPR